VKHKNWGDTFWNVKKKSGKKETGKKAKSTFELTEP